MQHCRANEKNQNSGEDLYPWINHVVVIGLYRVQDNQSRGEKSQYHLAVAGGCEAIAGLELGSW
jgi:hypothetical protein